MLTVPHRVGVAALLAGAVGALGVELSRRRLRLVRYRFLRYTRAMLRPRERRGLAGATYMALAFAAAVVLFPTAIAVTAMLYTALGDAVAALVGRRWGRSRLGNGKSLEGSAAAFLVNLSVGLAMPGIPWAAAIIGAVVATVLEAADLPPDDNLWVVLGGGAALWIVLLAAG